MMTRDEAGQMVALVVGAVLCCLLACGSTPRPEPVHVEVTRWECLREAPPTHAPIDARALFSAPCEEACIDARLALGQYLSALQRWSRTAWTMCGIAAEGDETP